jgi:hypothetical protein
MNYTQEDQERDWIKHHRKVLNGKIKIDLRRTYFYDPAKRRKKTKEEVLNESKDFLNRHGAEVDNG